MATKEAKKRAKKKELEKLKRIRLMKKAHLFFALPHDSMTPEQSIKASLEHGLITRVDYERLIQELVEYELKKQ